MNKTFPINSFKAEMDFIIRDLIKIPFIMYRYSNKLFMFVDRVRLKQSVGKNIISNLLPVQV